MRSNKNDMVFEEGPIKKGQLFVRGLTPSSNEKTLELAFSKFGPIEEIVVPKDRDTRECKGYGFLTFVSPEDAEDALKGMDGKELNGGTITVEEATQRRSMDRDRRGPPKGSMERDFGGRGGRGGFRGRGGSRGGRDSGRMGSSRDFGRGGGRDFGRGGGREFGRGGGYLGGGGRGSYRDSGRGRGGFSRDDDRGFSSGRGGRGGMRGGRGSSPRGGFRDGPSRFRDDGRGPPRERSRDTRDSFGSSYSGRDMGGYSNGSSSFRDSGFSSREGPRDYSDRGGDRYGSSRGGDYDSYSSSRTYDSVRSGRDYGSSRSSAYERDTFGGSGGPRYEKSPPREYGSSDRFGSMSSSRYDDGPRGPPMGGRYDDPPRGPPSSRYDDPPRGSGMSSRYDDPPRGPPSSRDGPYDSYSTSSGRGFDGGSRGPPPPRSMNSDLPGERGFGRGPLRDERGLHRGPPRDERGPPSRGPPRDDRGMMSRGPPRDDRRERRPLRDMDDGPPIKRPRSDGLPMRGGRGRGSFRGGPPRGGMRR